MTISEMMQWLEQFETEIAVGLVALPGLTYALGALLKRISRRSARLFLAMAIYLAVIPGICMAVLILYLLFFVRANLVRELHLVLHLLPVISMGATLWAASRLEAFDNIPGFHRLQGLMLLVGLSFAGILTIHKARLGVLFFARFEHLLLLLGGFVLLWQLGVGRLSKSRSATRRW